MKRRESSSMTEIDKINWHIYKLRCYRRYDEANRLDKLMETLKDKGMLGIPLFVRCL